MKKKKMKLSNHKCCICLEKAKAIIAGKYYCHECSWQARQKFKKKSK